MINIEQKYDTVKDGKEVCLLNEANKSGRKNGDRPEIFLTY